MTSICATSALLASRISSPLSSFFDRVDALPDSVVLVLVGIAMFFLVGLMNERDRARRARWAANADIDRVLELRKSLEGWNPPEQKHARNKAA